ncbi:ABC transporter [Nonomuraea longispora]|uniref:ABC transporter n=1 Tax=Nonomuraea longispora TaxID=1848320 RepID=A0A4R4N9D4_9ACTN|nr:ABC transporter [Nonomuraea longispora]TDC03850.1 ABC transporter [Nonomuraea longispora]
MSTTTETKPPVIRHRDVIVSEITKITSHPATRLMLAITVAANLMLAGIDAAGVPFYTTVEQLEGVEEPNTLSSFGIIMLAPIYAFLVIPVWAAATEHSAGQMRMSLAATPRRDMFVAAKSVAMLTATIIAAIIATVPARLVIGIADGNALGDLLIDSVQWVAAYMFMSVIAFGLAGILRSAIATLGILIGIPIVVATGILQWPDGIRFLPDQAALSLVGTPGYDVTELPPGIAALTLLIWSIVAVAAYAFAVTRRDA